MTTPSYARLVKRFLLLPFRHQIAVARSLTGFEVDTGDPLCAADTELKLFERMFRYVKENGLVEDLWYALESRHTNLVDHSKLYPLADWPTEEESCRLGFDVPHRTRGKERQVMARITGEFRKPKQGEWFLSGAIPQGYRAFADMDGEYCILELVVVRRVVTYEVEGET